ncbi:MAG TPA: T9SS type A sorting domain-containing protein [bacterium]
MPCPPKNLKVENFNSHPLLTWRANTEDDFDHYEVFRKYVMVGGDTTYPWESIADDVTETQYLDEEVTYLGGTRNHARYYVRAWDREDDPTALMSIPSNTVIFFCYLPVSEGEISGISEISPESFDIFVTPNPFNSSTVLSFELGDANLVKLTVYDAKGREVGELVDGWQSAGMHSITFDGSNLASGIYFARLQAGEFTGVQKLLLIK